MGDASILGLSPADHDVRAYQGGEPSSYRAHDGRSEIRRSEAGRVNYQYAPATTEGRRGDPHHVVKILTIERISH